MAEATCGATLDPEIEALRRVILVMRSLPPEQVARVLLDVMDCFRADGRLEEVRG